jgi:hypothetical protein
MNRLATIVCGFLWLFWAADARAADAVSLAGQWRFELDRGDSGVSEKWFARELPDKIRLPGILQAQGYGDDISTNTPWVLTLGNGWWKIQPAELREHFSQPGHVEVPFLSQPPKHYLGVAWYQRDLVIPEGARGRRFKLFLERAHWQSTVWVDDREFRANDSLVAPHVTDLGVLTPGKHRLSIRVDNRMQLPPAGHMQDAHSVSDALGAAWNGIVGKIELRSTPPVWVDDVQIFPEVKKKTIHARMTLHNLSGKEADGKISFFIESCPGTKALKFPPSSENFKTEATNENLEAEIKLDGAQTWDEFSPALYKLKVNTRGGTSDNLFEDNTEAIFGLREIRAQDQDMLINNRPVNLRLTHFGGDFPLTGYPATDVAAWKKIIQTCKNYGLNGMRFHSWCPPEAAFEAADEMGFYLQPECGLWSDFSIARMRKQLSDETARILAAYGNHPSFVLLSPSNEPRTYQRFTPDWAKTNYVADNRRLYSAASGWSDPAQVYGGPQFATLVRFGDGPLRGPTGWFGGDFRDALAGVHVPVLAHEIGQWCAYPDFGVIKKFTGYLRPGNYDIFKYIATREGVLDQDHDFAWASGRFQVECYKEEIEANLRTPGLAGFQLLDLHDYLGQGTALVGVLDAFWQPKGYVTAAEYRRFAGPTVPLARLAQRVFTNDQRFESEVELYHFGAEPIREAKPYWEIIDARRKVVSRGQWEGRDIPIGKNIPLGKVSADLSELAAPGAYKLLVGLQGTSIENDWNFWVYPARVEPSKTGDVLVTSDWGEAAKRLAAGGKVLFLPAPADLDRGKSPAMRSIPVYWNIQMTVRPHETSEPRFDAMLGLLCEKDHPALAEFPTEKNCDWQWTQLVNGVRSVNLSRAPRGLRPIVAAIDDWNRDWRLGVIFECNVGPGRLLVSAIDLNNERGGSELQQLRRSLLDYMGGRKFRPPATLTADQARSLWTAR